MKNYICIFIMIISHTIIAQHNQKPVPFQSDLQKTIVSIAKTIETSFNQNDSDIFTTIFPNEYPKTITYYSYGIMKTDTINYTNERLLKIKNGFGHAWGKKIISVKNYFKNGLTEVKLSKVYIDYYNTSSSSISNPNLILKFFFKNSNDFFYVILETIFLVDDNKIIFEDIEWKPFI
ncbi:hypothetical protein [Xanthomarina sp. F2636L]|uniref:hypothetical protein n=1 Tax=Xanthomarina sp. F2636L TaxID=2996018 RepID=UPI00225DEFAB|nr:hypothetical protein [Xanthomarina sp. F2636L]MCX7552127.1 hypothetical protein [Xanthomarina sp. F2636L]